MTIDEAIKSLEARVEYGRQNYPSFSTDDVQLGIEALERVKWHKAQHQVGYYELLLGETEE